MARLCELCPEGNKNQASFYCAADVCYLCICCDMEVHSANRLAKRHQRLSLDPNEHTDGASINDDSDARVPDFSSSEQSTLPSASACITPSASGKPKSSLNTSQSHDVSHCQTELPLASDVPVSFEDAADYDFCFGPIATRMMPIPSVDDDALANLFVDPKSSSKTFYRDLSWDSIVNVPLEHVVPDVSDLRQFPQHSSSQDHLSISTSIHDFTGNTKQHQDVLLKSHSEQQTASTTPSRLKSENLPSPVDTDFNDMTHSHQNDLLEHDETPSHIADVVMDDHSQSPLQSAAAPSNEDSVYSSDQGAASTDSTLLNEEAALKQYEEERKKRRTEALARFRLKRQKRSFTKKVRYECRKQLADSRPRVKGRFVRKVEMALFHKYGALYRDHLHELNPQPDEQCVPTT